MRDLSLHVLDIAENSVRAGAGRIRVGIEVDAARDTLTLEVADDGEGMDGEAVKSVTDAFFTTKPGKRIGLGLPLLAQAAEAAGGNLAIVCAPGGGTRVTAVFRLSHPDRKPVGDMEKTMRLLRAAYADVEFEYRLTVAERQGERHETEA